MDDKATAARIADDHYAESSGRHERLTNAIVAALEAARRDAITHDHKESLRLFDAARKVKGIIDCTGEPIVRRVLGRLPVLQTGEVGGEGATMWHPDLMPFPLGSLIATAVPCVIDGKHYEGPLHGASVCGCYSTPEAAKAAMEGGTREG